MKQIILLYIFIVGVFSSNAQFSSDLVIFSATQENFFVSIDNVRVNAYETNKVRVNDISPGYHNISVTVQNRTKTILVQPINIVQNTELAVVISVSQVGLYFLETFVAIDYTGNISPNITPLPPVPQDDYNGFCDYPIDDSAFNTALFAIKNQDFDSDKLTVAKQIVASNCLRSVNIKTIMTEFSFESSKIDFAKYSYTHIYDPENFYLINDAFDFSSSIDDLNDYISSLD